VSGEDWQRWARFRASVLPRLVVIYDADCGVCFLICRWLHRLDAYDRLGFLPNDSPAVPSSVSSETLASTVVVIGDRDERVLTRAAAVAAIVGVLPAGRPLSWLLGRAPIAALADGAYQRFAARRAAVSQWLGFDACGLGGAGPSTESSVPSTEPASRAPRVVADAAALVLALLCGAGLLRGGAVGASAHVSPLDVAVRYARLAPAPDRLSPDPPRWSGALVVEGVTASGAHLDPLTQRPPRASPLDDPSAETEGALLLAYFERVSEPRHAVYLDGLREYVKRAAVRGDPRQRVTSFVLVWLTVPLGAAGEDGAASGPTRTELGAYP